MQAPSLDFKDPTRSLGISLETYNPFESAGFNGAQAFFSVPGGTYDFVPLVEQLTPGEFRVSFKGVDQFTGSNFKRSATIDFSGTADENTGAADLSLKADGSTFHLSIPGADISDGIALSRRIAADIQAKNWPDAYATFAPSLKQFGYTEADLSKDLNASYRHVGSACRLGPARYLRSQSPPAENLTDVIAVTVNSQSGPATPTFATIELERENGSWFFLGGNAPGISPGATGPNDFGIPAPPP